MGTVTSFSEQNSMDHSGNSSSMCLDIEAQESPTLLNQTLIDRTLLRIPRLEHGLTDIAPRPFLQPRNPQNPKKPARGYISRLSLSPFRPGRLLNLPPPNPLCHSFPSEHNFFGLYTATLAENSPPDRGLW